ncbi:hypothetical protein V495_03124 [Pseudogymnoascus sp. VKM F-4514 (FW-929)]|nr:hypothetical protein V495_03124 [Pseudogymnoascus sp. VKM F-4514 (FW-929)]KFY62169.1 hypothetical protein V497_02529 [Pseudogymnoascus sp. VKM F-4516 (FW-969)]
MASCAILPYSSSHYNSLPEFFEAKETFKAKNASSTIQTTLAALFMRHNVHENLGIQMLHTHFEISDDERLISIGAVAVPIELDTIVGSAVKPLVYRFVPSGVAVCEWTQGDDANEVNLSSPQYSAFMADLRTVLDDAGLIDVLGIFVRQPGDGESKGVEFTAGRANITLHKANPSEGGTAVEASWVFQERPIAPEDGNTRVMAACTAWCRAFVGTHSSRHKEKGGRYALERETQGASFKGPDATIEAPAEVAAPAIIATPVDASTQTDPADPITNVMAACNSWCQEFVGNHSSRHKEKGGRYALETKTEGVSSKDASEPATAPAELASPVDIKDPAEVDTTVDITPAEPTDPITNVMAACNSWCQEFVGNHSSRHKEKGGRYALEAETQGLSLKDESVPAPIEAPIETRAMAACNSWCQEFVGNHSQRHKEKGG